MFKRLQPGLIANKIRGEHLSQLPRLPLILTKHSIDESLSSVGFLESLNLELRAMHKAIETTVVCPFYINTGMFDGVKSR